ncbi:MAG: site-2 protease family protein, partial [Myxococcota bacterium]|nr:site-2 protease family protein [Myxococcota bacterium]
TYSLGVERDGKRHEFALEVFENPRARKIGHVGVGPHQKELLVRHGPLQAIGPSLRAPFRILKDFVDGIRAMAMRRVSSKLLAGPVGILQATYTFAEKSTGDLLNFLALLSVNLAIVNFLPIPITDGGHFVFLMYEKIKGRRMEDEMAARFQWAGLVFLLLVLLYATFNDVERLFGF